MLTPYQKELLLRSQREINERIDQSPCLKSLLDRLRRVEVGTNGDPTNDRCRASQKQSILEGEVNVMNITLDQVAPEVAQALIAQATARGLSINDYLRQLLGLNNGAVNEVAVADTRPEPPRNEEMLAIIRRNRERLKDMPVRGSTEETLKMLRRARAGEMWGYEPTDFE
jgi:hypothetical protein